MFDTKEVLTRDELRTLGLPTNPFPERPRTGKIFGWAQLSQLISAAQDALFDNEMVALVGPSGAGKSTVLSELRTQLERDKNTVVVDLAAADKGRLNDWAVEVSMLEALGVGAKGIPSGAERRAKKLLDLLQKRARAQGRTVILCDDFHDASSSVLKVLRRHREADSRLLLFSVVMAGQLPLLSALRSDALMEVGGRTQVLELPALGGRRGNIMLPNSGEAFIRWHFEQIGIADSSRYFTPEGCAEIATIAEYPLWVRNLAVRALKEIVGKNRPVDPSLLARLRK